MTTKPLTPRQREVMEILIRTTENGCQASKREMGFALGVGSTNAISGHMLRLERDGYIRNRGENKSRSVAILRNPDGSEYLSPKQRIEALVEALGCTGQSFGEALAVARSCGQRGETEFDEHAEPHPMGER